MTTSWLITGAEGQLGRELRRMLADRSGDEVVPLTRRDVDLADETGVRDAVRAWLRRTRSAGRSARLLNTAAYTAVDRAESDEATAHLVNAAAPGWLAEEMVAGGRLVHVSTDYVFDGTASRPYREDDEPAPRTAYGRTKLAGERAVAGAGGDSVVVRTSWLYSGTGPDFVRTMLDRAAGSETVAVVEDQTGSPTWTRDLASALIEAAFSRTTGTVHATNSGKTTWYGLACRVFERAGADPARVVPITSADLARPAARPAYSVLDGSGWAATGLRPLPPWQVALDRCLSGLGVART